MHPLYQLELEVCLPFLDPCIGVARRCFKSEKRVVGEDGKPLAHADVVGSEYYGPEDWVKNPIEEDGYKVYEPLFDFELDDDEDAMGRFSYGIVSYFSLIYTFLIIFLLLTIGHLPMMYNYASWKAYEGEKQLSLTTQLTIGNLGQSMPRCAAIKLVGNTLPIGCNTGQISG